MGQDDECLGSVKQLAHGVPFQISNCCVQCLDHEQLDCPELLDCYPICKSHLNFFHLKYWKVMPVLKMLECSWRLLSFSCFLYAGMNKMVINHLDKLFVTNDAATIVNELEVQHPAAKILVLAGRAQQEEIGDGANLTISFAGELLQKAEELIRMGLHPSEIIIGYTKAINKVTYPPS